ncbi:polysaccharide biosynthesis/export family protein [Paraflavitalea sp. CAU 1676]|uniref:polysaccharide biosynthesis/export family protein n=1 Tax=Paraflavitalea sp. CAU 1676 TaxID=3032598 RepID=UPI0023D9EEB6|nr:polysaccharide biosynthesis/export family protein [Paraflavitalea sp. CAU 1676]MDF2189647.1 polysaccharide biosynthesis/export family protein [Paraflavitalea sp. CAU 1676]
MKRITFSRLHLQMIVFVCLATSVISCTSSKKLNYFNDLPDSTYVKLPPVVEEERVIGKGDVLDISFSAKDQDAVTPFNKQTSAAMTPAPGAKGATPIPAQGYTVDPLGAIEMPVIGKMEVKGMTSRQLKNRLTTMVSPYLKDPIVEVKFSSFNVTVLGEVRAPGTFSLPSNRTTIFEALAAAGDLPHSAKKYNVKLYRDYNGERAVIKIDLNDKSLLYNHQVFQMRPNDVLYVQTRKGSIFKEDFGLFASIVTLVVSIVTLGLTISN